MRERPKESAHRRGESSEGQRERECKTTIKLNFVIYTRQVKTFCLLLLVCFLLVPVIYLVFVISIAESVA